MFKLSNIKDKAKNLGINPGRMSRTELIRNIQVKEGNEPCFDSKRDNCDQLNCYWREICL